MDIPPPVPLHTFMSTHICSSCTLSWFAKWDCSRHLPESSYGHPSLCPSSYIREHIRGSSCPLPSSLPFSSRSRKQSNIIDTRSTFHPFSHEVFQSNKDSQHLRSATWRISKAYWLLVDPAPALWPPKVWNRLHQACRHRLLQDRIRPSFPWAIATPDWLRCKLSLIKIQIICVTLHTSQQQYNYSTNTCEVMCF